MKHHCPICRKPTDSERDADFPFCSERCRLHDLGNWASEKYVVSDPIFEEDEAEELGSRNEPERDDSDDETGNAGTDNEDSDDDAGGSGNNGRSPNPGRHDRKN